MPLIVVRVSVIDAAAKTMSSVFSDDFEASAAPCAKQLVTARATIRSKDRNFFINIFLRKVFIYQVFHPSGDRVREGVLL